MEYVKHHNPSATKQTEKADKRQVKNSAGGFTFALDKWKRLERFLILGTEGTTLYAGEAKRTKEECKSLQECVDEDPIRVVNLVVEISTSKRAPKNDPAVYALALAMCSKNPEAKKAAYEALPKVARIGTDLFHAFTAVKAMRGMGRGIKKAFADWYINKNDRSLMYQLAKYRQRDGVSHRDVFRQVHPVFGTPERNVIARWVLGADSTKPYVVGAMDESRLSKSKKPPTKVRTYPAVGVLPEYLQAFDQLQKASSTREVIELIEKHGFTHEMVPTHLHGPDVFEALLPTIPAMALVRSLGKMSAMKLFEHNSDAAKLVIEKLKDAEYIKKSGIHPIKILLALATYRTGRGFKGSLTWTPNQRIVDALDDAYYLAFGNVVPCNKSIMYGMDISGSMYGATIVGTHITAAEASAALAMVTMRTEPDYLAIGFTAGTAMFGGRMTHSYGVTELPISPKMRLGDVVDVMKKQPMGQTDCAQPILYALNKKLKFDAFVVTTDSETYAGSIHPHQALDQYRDKMGIDAKLIVVGMVTNGFSIAKPDDPRQIDIVGFDTNTPQAISNFIGGAEKALDTEDDSE